MEGSFVKIYAYKAFPHIANHTMLSTSEENAREEIRLFWQNMKVDGEPPMDLEEAVSILRLRYVAQHPECPVAK